MNYREIRETARNKFVVNKGVLVLIFFIYSLLSSVSMFTIGTPEDDIYFVTSSISSIVAAFLAGPLAYGAINVVRINHTGLRPQVGQLFAGFKYFWKLFVLSLLMSIYITLWTLLFIVPGIIKSYSYAMAFYIYLDNPELSANECITRSKEMMKGHKWEMFVLGLSYIGHFLLVIVTLGIYSLWLTPKMEIAFYEFYLIISGKKNAESEVETEVIYNKSSSFSSKKYDL